MTEAEATEHLVTVENNDDSGKRIDLFLSELIPELSRNRVQKLIEDGKVTLAGKNIKKNHRVELGEELTVRIPAARASEAQAENIPLNILFQDKDLLVIAKPAGISVHPSPAEISGTLVNALLYHVKDLSGIGGVERPGIVHRLDKDTSGVMIVAKNDQAHEALAVALAAREVKRQYYALVLGSPEEEEASIDMPIARSRTDRKRMSVDKDGRPSITHFRVMERLGPFALLDIDLSTGRTHQIRVHLAHIGMPVVGDPVYLDRGKMEKLKREAEIALGQSAAHMVASLKRQFLHAYSIQFTHPTTGEKMKFMEDLPKDLKRVLEAVRQNV